MSKKISQLDQALGSQVYEDDLYTFVDVSETDPDLINKAVQADELTLFLKNYSNLFPLDFSEDYINTDAFVDNVQVPIADKVKNQTVNIADIGSLKFDAYGRVYDYTNNTEVAANVTLIGSGTTGTWYKTAVTGDFTTAQPGTLTGNSLSDGADNAGYFTSTSYYYPQHDSYTSPYYQYINYNDRQENDYDWTYLFSKTYGRYKKTKIEMTVGATYMRDVAVQGISKIYLEIDWENSTAIGNGILASWNNTNFTFYMNGSLSGVTTITGVLTDNDYVAPPKLIIDNDNKKITGLPIPTPIYGGYYQNGCAPVSVIITNYT